jgi:hypothetical protein
MMEYSTSGSGPCRLPALPGYNSGICHRHQYRAQECRRCMGGLLDMNVEQFQDFR